MYEDDVLYLLMYDNIINHNITHQYTECNIRSPLGGGGGGDSSGGRLLYTPHQSLPSLTVLTCLFMKITWSRQLINDYNVLLGSSHLPSGPHQFLLETLDLADEFGL